jgi:hypothetical protein
MKRFHFLLPLIFIFCVALTNPTSTEADAPKFHSLTSALFVQQTPVNDYGQNTSLSLVLKSPPKAFLFSAIIPGTGQIYAETQRGYFYIAAEVGLLASYFITHRNASSLRDDYKQQVIDHVRIDFGPEIPPDKIAPLSRDKILKDWNMEDYEHSTMYDNWRGHAYTDNNPESDTGEPVERTGKFYWDDIPETAKNQKRERSDSQNRQIALDYREKSNSRFKLAKTFIGLVIFNHAFSAIDARIAAKLYNKRLISEKSGLSFKTTILSDSIESRFIFYRRF